ncbi:MAG: hypothetical protein J6K21_05480 [Bacilli bacterium]|nr:hypothetical protein [Bacilli bacterium]
MKNVINYYYNLNPEEIRQVNKMYKFKINNDFYTLMEIENDIKKINEIYEISVELNIRGIYTHTIITNLQNSIITYINNNTYVLLKTYSKMNEEINLKNVIEFSNITTNIVKNDSLKRDNWYQLWINKIDYFEYQINQIGKKYKLIRESFSYYAGILETGISLLVNTKLTNITLSICHNRIRKNDTLFDLYNPFNFIIDSKVRDAAEYFKEQFKYNDPYESIIKYLEYNNLTDDEIILFYIRMLYPSFYFDLYEEIISSSKEEKEIKKIIDKAEEYELLLKKLYIYINNKIALPEIEWIKKM